MTEEEWLAATNPGKMWRYFQEDKLSIRKRLLYGAACCRRIWFRLTDERSCAAVETAERYADGLANAKELELAAAAAHVVFREIDYNPTSAYGTAEAAEAAENAAYLYAYDIVADSSARGCALDRESWKATYERESLEQCKRLRDIFGNPFRPFTFDSSWRTPTVKSLAAAIYEERQLPSGLFDNSRLGVLADALEEAGCDNADILGHLRNGRDHVRGCHVIDLILGKE